MDTLKFDRREGELLKSYAEEEVDEKKNKKQAQRDKCKMIIGEMKNYADIKKSKDNANL